MSFELNNVPPLDTWRSLVDSSLGVHEEAVRKILEKSMNRDTALRMLTDYVYSDDNVSKTMERDNSEKLGFKMPEFVSDEEETLWNLFVQLRSDMSSTK